MYNWFTTTRVPANSQRYIEHPNKDGFNTVNAYSTGSYYSTFRVEYDIGGNQNFKIELLKNGVIDDSVIVKNGKGVVYFNVQRGWYKIRLTNYNRQEMVANIKVITEGLTSR